MTVRRLFQYLLPVVMALCASLQAQTQKGIFNVRDFGATGKKADDALPAIQKAIDTCAATGGGSVFLPAGEYTSGQIRLRSHVRLYIDSGATLYASLDGRTFDKDKAALMYGENLENITIEGRGTVDGQAEYEWRTLSAFDDA